MWLGLRAEHTDQTYPTTAIEFSGLKTDDASSQFFPVSASYMTYELIYSHPELMPVKERYFISIAARSKRNCFCSNYQLLWSSEGANFSIVIP